jgi:hypothetical protein
MACISLYTVRDGHMKNFVARQDDSAPNSLWSKKCFRHVTVSPEFFQRCTKKKNLCRGGAQTYNPLQISTENTEKRNSKSERGLDGGGGGRGLVQILKKGP